MLQRRPAATNPDTIRYSDGDQDRDRDRDAKTNQNSELPTPAGPFDKNEGLERYGDNTPMRDFRVPTNFQEANQFQLFVEKSLNRRLPLFGTSLFDQVPTTFAPADRVPVTADYVIGPGDELLIRAWGQIDVDARVVVDRSGSVYIPKVGNISVVGLKYQQLGDYLKTAIGRIFHNFDLTVSLGQLRSIQVFVLGQARRPGVYTVSSLSTLVNTLFASGGPSPKGSMRHVQLKRSGKVVSDFDLYDLLLQGDKSKDVALLPGDVIYIPPVGPLVALNGSVNTPAIYELHDHCSLGDAIKLAGGLVNTAEGKLAHIERIENRTAREVATIGLDDAGLSKPLQDGDVITIRTISPRFENAVTLRGNVAQPGRYPWHEGMRVRDLIPNADALITRAFWDKHNDSGNHLNEIAVRNDVNWEYAVVQRVNPEDLSTRLLPFKLGKALAGDETENLQLKSGDIITVYSQSDVAVPVEKRPTFVTLEGEFNHPGIYRVSPGETLRQLVERVGGLTDDAYLFGSVFTRESARKEQAVRLNRYIADLEKEVQGGSHKPSLGTAEENNFVARETERQTALLASLRQLKPTGRVVLNIRPTDSVTADLPSVALEDQDRIYVPAKPATVDVIGSVYNEASFLYQHNLRVKDYLKQAGGARRTADSGRLYVIQADGSVVSRKFQSGLFTGGIEDMHLMPGSAVVVPEQLERGTFMRGLKDWSQIISQFALGVAAARVLNQ